MATAREPIKQAGYISATSDILQNSLLRSAAGPYIRVKIPVQTHAGEGPVLAVHPPSTVMGKRSDCTLRLATLKLGG
jgi:hypothetical protein